MTRLYDVKTEKFGTVVVSRDNIREARAWAKGGFGLPPSAVTPHSEAEANARREREDAEAQAAFVAEVYARHGGTK